MKKNILIVDDSPVVLSMLSDMLEHLGYGVTCAQSGNEGCKHIEDNRYNMIITDLNMPGMDGVEFTKSAKQMQNCKFVPIIMLSGEHDETRISEAKRVGISTFLKKPVKINQLKTILQVVLGP